MKKYLLSNDRFEPLPKALGLLALTLSAGALFWGPSAFVGGAVAASTLLGFPWLRRFSVYSGPLGNRPVWSMNRHRTHVLVWWRLFRSSAGCSREVMAAMLAANLREKAKQAHAPR